MEKLELRSRFANFFILRSLEHYCEKDNPNDSKSATEGGRWRAKCIPSPSEVNNVS